MHFQSVREERNWLHINNHVGLVAATKYDLGANSNTYESRAYDNMSYLVDKYAPWPDSDEGSQD
jgi:hypothetical protein